MNIGPIIASLRRHKTAVLLITLQVAVACAILCNATFLVSERVNRMLQPSGIDDGALVMVQSIGLDPDKKNNVKIAEDLAALRRVPGVEAVTDVGQFPFASNSWRTGLSLTENQEKPTVLSNLVTASSDFAKVSGITMKQGRWFAPDEFQSADLFSGGEVQFPSVVVTADLARALFPDANAIGKVVYGISKGPSRIIGIANNMLGPGGSPGGDAAMAYMDIFVPTSAGMTWYVIRTTKERRAEVLRGTVDALNAADGNRIINSQNTLEEMRDQYYSRDRAVSWLLVAVSILLLAITAFGIGGLASFWVQQRTKQIGVRRALGATRGDILSYFRTENFLIVTMGIILGMLMAYGINQLLMSKYEMPRLPWVYLPIGAIMLWLLGQLSVLAPALRAASIPPATATRSV